MDFKFNKLYNTIMEDVKSSKIKAKKVIKEAKNKFPTITVGKLKEELSKCDPEEEIGFSWNTYSDGGDMCGGCYYDKNSKAFYFVQYTPGEDGYEYDEEEDLDENGDWLNGPPAPAPTVQEVLDKIKNIPDNVKVFGSWEANEGARYCICDISGSHLELDGGTEC